MMKPYNLYAITNGHDARRMLNGRWSQIMCRPTWLCSVDTVHQLDIFKAGLLLGSGTFDHSGHFTFVGEADFIAADNAAVANLKRTLPPEFHNRLTPLTPEFTT